MWSKLHGYLPHGHKHFSGSPNSTSILQPSRLSPTSTIDCAEVKTDEWQKALPNSPVMKRRMSNSIIPSICATALFVCKICKSLRRRDNRLQVFRDILSVRTRVLEPKLLPLNHPGIVQNTFLPHINQREGLVSYLGLLLTTLLLLHYKNVQHKTVSYIS